MSLEIRKETPNDLPAIESVTVAAFQEAPHTRHTEQHIIKALREAGKLSLSLVAISADRVIGHVAVSPVAISDGASGWFGLGPLSVMPEHQQRGVGSRLVTEALRLLRESGAAGCVVLGDPGYYGRFGFQAHSSLVLPHVPPEYFQAIAFGPAKPRGEVSYDAVFNE